VTSRTSYAVVFISSLAIPDSKMLCHRLLGSRRPSLGDYVAVTGGPDGATATGTCLKLATLTLLGRKVDLVGMDACLMTTIEVAYHHQDTPRSSWGRRSWSMPLAGPAQRSYGT
jgi:hypothetical protein